MRSSPRRCVSACYAALLTNWLTGWLAKTNSYTRLTRTRSTLVGREYVWAQSHRGVRPFPSSDKTTRCLGRRASSTWTICRYGRPRTCAAHLPACLPVIRDTTPGNGTPGTVCRLCGTAGWSDQTDTLSARPSGYRWPTYYVTIRCMIVHLSGS